MKTDPHMGLRIWDEPLDLYSHEQLADNWAKAGAHNHTNGQGVPIPVGGIETGVLNGSWETLTLGAKLAEFAGQTPAARFESGNSAVRLRGSLKVTSGLKATEEVFTLPTSIRPAFTVYLRPMYGTYSSESESSHVVATALLKIAATTGVATLVGLPTGVTEIKSSAAEYIYLDCLTFNFS